MKLGWTSRTYAANDKQGCLGQNGLLFLLAMIPGQGQDWHSPSSGRGIHVDPFLWKS